MISALIGLSAVILLLLIVLGALIWAHRLKDEDIPELNDFDYHRSRTIHAEENFNQADSDHLDVAIVDLNLARQKYSNEYRKARVGSDPTWTQELLWVKRDKQGRIVGVTDRLPGVEGFTPLVPKEIQPSR